MKKFVRIMMVILFPIGILYCIGRALFTGNGFASYLGMIFIFGIGILLGVHFGNPEITRGLFQAVDKWLGWFV